MTSEIQKNLVEKNAEYARTFDQGDLALPPAKHYLVVTCMDARVDPAAAFGISLGDAHVIRNAGASAKDAQRSIIISQQLLGTREILLVKHTGCGMLTFTNDDAHALVKQNLGPTAAAELGPLDFLPFAEVEAAVEEDVGFLKRSATVPEDVKISGWVYEVETGRVRQVV
ncbi:beta carbonic anhydrase clade D [Xylaria bambusicola]|uniref:beta carbonic anhydrase clade D n=1 Tax=Xylaria bambusicola TaxID=326684 RepID=UPI0020072CC0|nr:beta carbonic anhydrase clade D [Xylaria bambusicola]KAI0523659.1 beta carbonic anhydrase clade D [Xylaria bambusicola]